MLFNLVPKITNMLHRLDRQMDQALETLEENTQYLNGRQRDGSSLASCIPSSFPSFTPSVGDVHAVKRLLMQKPRALPLELAILILDYAEYWPVLARAERADHVRIAASELPQNAIADLYLATPALPLANVEKGERAKPREVNVWTKSRDQGWVSQRGRQLGPYDHSYSWFEACIFRPCCPGTSSSTSTATALPHLDCVPHPADAVPDLSHASMCFVPRTVVKQQHDEQTGQLEAVHETRKVGLWRLHCNRVAEGRYWRHQIVWREDDEGDGQGFVETLKEGDRIGVWARAMFPGWANEVEAVVIQVRGSVI